MRVDTVKTLCDIQPEKDIKLLLGIMILVVFKKLENIAVVLV